jgi:hypothetical protein
MRKVILGMNITLDGYVVGPNGEIDFFIPHLYSRPNGDGNRVTMQQPILSKR